MCLCVCVSRKERCFHLKSWQSEAMVDSCPEVSSKDSAQSWVVFFFNFLILYWNIADYQCCGNSRCTAKGLSHTHTSIHSPARGFPGGSAVKNLPANAGDLGFIPGWEDPLEKGMATHSSTLAWLSPWTEEPGGLQSLGSQRVRHDWAHRAAAAHSPPNLPPILAAP